MSRELTDSPVYRAAMDRLEAHMRETAGGVEYWFAREINTIFGYPTWREFGYVVDRARAAFRGNGIDPSHQIVLTHKVMEVGKGAKLRGDDYYLSRAACYLIAMNGSSKGWSER